MATILDSKFVKKTSLFKVLNQTKCYKHFQLIVKKEFQIKVEMIKVCRIIAQKKSYHGLPS